MFKAGVIIVTLLLWSLQDYHSLVIINDSEEDFDHVLVKLGDRQYKVESLKRERTVYLEFLQNFIGGEPVYEIFVDRDGTIESVGLCGYAMGSRSSGYVFTISDDLAYHCGWLSIEKKWWADFYED